MRKYTEIIVVSLLVGVILVGVVYAATLTWTGGGDGSKWSDAANWGGTALQSGDTVIFTTDDNTFCDTNITLALIEYRGTNKTSTLTITEDLTVTNLYVGQPAGSKHTLTISDSKDLTVRTKLAVGGVTFNVVGGDGYLEISGGTSTINNLLYIGEGRTTDGLMVITNDATVNINASAFELGVSDSGGASRAIGTYKNYSPNTTVIATNMFIGYQYGTGIFENAAGQVNALTNYIGFTTGAAGYQIHRGGSFTTLRTQLASATATSGNLAVRGGTYTVSNSYVVTAGKGTMNFSGGVLKLPNTYGDPVTNSWFTYDGDGLGVNSSFDGTYWTVTSVPKPFVPQTEFKQKVPNHPTNWNRVTNWQEGRQ